MMTAMSNKPMCTEDASDGGDLRRVGGWRGAVGGMPALCMFGMSLIAPCLAYSAPSPDPTGILRWTGAEQIYAYRNMDKIYPTHIIQRGTTVRELPRSKSLLNIHYIFDGEAGSVDAYMTKNHVAGLLVLKDGKVALEQYRLDEKPSDRWTSFSMAKSVSSILVGVAVAQGKIKSVDDQIDKYIPELKGTSYDGVTISQVLEMRSGVKWNEDYEQADSDVARSVKFMMQNQKDGVLTQMAALPREAPPGTKFEYKTGESDLLGVLLARATGGSVSRFLSDTIWKPYGMEKDAFWVTEGGVEIGGCCISATLRDYGRFGQFLLDGGRIDGHAVLPENWIRDSTHMYSKDVFGDIGYGYQWWLHEDGAFEAIGIYGQSILIDPRRHLVIVQSSAWPKADWMRGYERGAAFLQAVRVATDAAGPS